MAAGAGPRGPHRQRFPPPCATASSSDDESGPLSSRDEAARLNRLLAPVQPITGEELRQLVLDKWGVSYDVRLQKRGSRIYLHIMWRYLEQKSFPLSEEEYEAQLQAVADYLNLWEVQERVRAGIKNANKRGPGYTGGGNARAISIPLDVDTSGGRSGEWNSF